MSYKNSLLKHGNFDFALFGGGGVDNYLKSDFSNKNFKFCLENQGGW